MKKAKFFNNIIILAALVVLISFVTINIRDKNVSARDTAYEKLQVFTEVLSLVEKDYVEEVKNEELVQGAIKGMLKTLDPHSAYMTPEVFREMQVETEGEFGGLGIEITIKDEQLTVVAPIDDTPASKEGIEAGDIIAKINGEPTKNISIMDAVKKLRGKRGTKVTITIVREGLAKPKDITITRDIIKVKSVRKGVFDKKIGYVRIRNFQKTTDSELEEALEELETKYSIQGLVLDLRNNPGGLLQQAVAVSDRFLEGGQLIVYTKGRKEDQNMRFVSDAKKSHLKYPVVVLVNSGSASASEIVAGSLQDLERAVIMGTVTFGKGSVQTVIPLSDGSGLRLTTARYYTPKGRLIQNKGIVPDIVVENKPIKSAKLTEAEKKAHAVREKDLKNHLKGNEKSLQNKNEKMAMEIPKDDIQMERAVSLLKGWKIFKETMKMPSKTEAQTQ